MSLITTASVQKLQTALHEKAKESLNFRFYLVYDKVTDETFWNRLTPAAKLTEEKQEWTNRS